MPSTFPITKSKIETVTKIPNFDTIIINYGNKAEQRISNLATPRFGFKLKLIEPIEDAIMVQITDFFIARKGSYESFYFQNPEEAYRKTKWLANTAYIVGDIVRPTTPTGRAYKCTVAGTSGSSQPSWPTTVNGTVADSGVTWTENTYRVRFAINAMNIDYFKYSIYDLGEISFIEVTS